MKTGLNEKKPDSCTLSLGELGRLLNVEVKGDRELRLRGINSLDAAVPGQLSFIVDARYQHLVGACRASALIVPPDLRELDRNLLITGNPYLALARAAQLLLDRPAEPSGVHPTAVIGEGVELGRDVSICAHACIEGHCVIGAGTRIGAGAYIGENVRIGEECVIHARVAIHWGCIIGSRVIIHSGAVIGADGFGYAQDEQGRHVKIPQIGIAQIDDDVEIGANTTIDRATFGRTWIQRGAKIDNLVMIGHNVVVGEDSIFAGQVGVSGSTRIGRQVMLGGQAGIAGHIEIGDGARVGAKSGIFRPVEPKQTVVGLPALPAKEYFRNLINIQRLPKLKEELKRLGEKAQQIEEALKRDDGHL